MDSTYFVLLWLKADVFLAEPFRLVLTPKLSTSQHLPSENLALLARQ